MNKDVVDERVVKLELDNSNFEKKSKESMRTIDKLDEKLQFKDVEDSIKKIEFQFSKMEVVAIAAISNITNRVVNLGIQLVKSLSVDNISAGWTKFGEKTQSVGTMMAQSIKIAGKELTNQEEKLEEITKQLEKLNWFTDETSYNFTDMVSNIGKFTAAGQDLDASVNAMMGIANWAALSGQNAAVASRAMYQLAQAMGKGSITLIDYKSIQNANMDTQEFRQTVLDTAVALGQLTKSGNEFITKTGKKFTKNQFAEYLNEKWFSSEVLVKSLEKYSSAVERIYEISQETGLTASQVMARYGDELDEFGLKALKAAQEARTLTDALNAVKDAVSTQWMNIAEKVFGGYDESVAIWTELANKLVELFTERTYFINDVLKAAGEMNSRKNLFDVSELKETQGAFWNIYDSIMAIRNVIKSSWDEIFPKSQFTEYEDQVKEVAMSFTAFTKVIREHTLKVAKDLEENKQLTEIFRGLFGILATGLYMIKALRYAADPLIYSVKEVVSLVYNRIAGILGDTSKLEGVINKINSVAERLNATTQKLMEILNPAGLLSGLYNYIVRLFDAINETKPLEKLENLITSLYNAIEEILIDSGRLERVFNGIITIVSALGNGIIKLVKILNKTLVPVLDKIIDFFEGMIEVILDLSTIAFGYVGDTMSAFGDLSSDIGSTLGNGRTLKGLISFLDGIVTAIRNFKKDLSSLEFDGNQNNPILDLITGIVKLLEGAISVLSPLISLLGRILGTIGDLLKKIGNFLNNMFSSLQEFAVDSMGVLSIIIVALSIVAAIKYIYWLFDTIKSWISPLAYAAEALGDAAFGLYKYLNSKGLALLIQACGIALLEVSVSLALLSLIDWKKAWPGVVSLGVFAGILIALVITMSIINKNAFRAGKTFETFKDGMLGIVGAIRDSIKGMAVFTSLGRMMKELASSMLIVSLAFIILSKLDWAGISKGIAVMGVFLVGMLGSILLLSKFGKKIGKGINMKAISGTFTGFAGMSIAIATAAGSIKKISELDPKKMWSAFGAISALILVIMGSMTLLNAFSKTGFKGGLGAATELNALAISINLMILPLIVLGNIDTNKLWKSVAVIATLTAILTAAIVILNKFAMTTNKFSKSVKNGNGATHRLTQALEGSQTDALFVHTKKLDAGMKETHSAFDGLRESIKATLNTMLPTLVTVGALIAGLIAFTTSILILGALPYDMAKEGLIRTGIIITAFSAMMVLMKVLSKGLNIKKGLAILLEGLTLVLALINFTSSMILLSILPTLLIIKGLITTSAILFTFVGVLSVLNKIKSVMKPSQAGAMILECIGLSIALIAFTGSLILLGSFVSLLKWETIGKLGLAFIALSGLLLVVSLAIGIMNKSLKESTIKAGVSIMLSLVGLSIALIAFSAGLMLLAAVPWESCFKALTMIAGIAVILGAVAFVLLKIGGPLQQANGIIPLFIGLSIGLLAFSATLWILVLYPWKRAWPTLLAVTGIIVALGIVAKIIGSSGGTFKSALSGMGPMIGLSVLLLVFAASLWILCLYPWDRAWPSAVALGAAILAFAGAIAIINKSSSLFSSSKGVIGSMIALSVLLLVFASSMILISDVPWQVILVSMLSLAAVIGTVIGSLALINKLGLGVSDLLVLAGSLAILAGSLLLFAFGMQAVGSVGLGSVAKSLLVVISALALLSITALAIQQFNLQNILIQLAISMILVGVGMMSASLALELFGNNFSGAAKAIIQNAPLIGDMFAAILDAADKALPSLINLVKDVLIGILDLIIEVSPKLIEAGLNILVEFLAKLAEKLPDILASLGSMIMTILDWLYVMAGPVAKKLVMILVRVVEAIADSIGVLITAIEFLITKLLAEIFWALPKIWDSLGDFPGKKILGWILGFEEMRAIGNAINGIAENLRGTMNNELNTLGASAAKAFNDGMNDFMGIHSPSKKMMETGEYIVEGLEIGIGDNPNIIGESVGEAFEAGVTDTLGINSPSKFMKNVGEGQMEGLAIGLEEGGNKAASTMEDTVNKALTDVQNIIDSEVNEDGLVIRPIVDLSDVTAKAGTIGSIMGGIGSTSISADMATSVSRSMSSKDSGINQTGKNQNGSQTNTYNDTYQVTFNVTSDDPEEIAKQVDAELQKMRTNSRLARGGV